MICQEMVNRGREITETMDWSKMPDSLSAYYYISAYWRHNRKLVEKTGVCEHDCKHPGVLMGRNKVRVCPATGRSCSWWLEKTDT